MPKPTRILGPALIAVLVSIAAIYLLMRTEPQRPEPRFTSLHQASVFDAEQIQPLVEAGAKLDGLDADGHTPLWLAVRCDKPDAVHELLKMGADPDAGGPRADSPLLVATFMGSQPVDTLIAGQLIEAGADVNAVGRQHEETPLHYAVRSNNVGVVQLLVNSGANVNAQCSEGSTPLQWAVVTGDPAISDLLLASGADPELRNSAGFRPIDQLNVCPNPKPVQAVFRAHGADDQRRPELLAAARATFKG